MRDKTQKNKHWWLYVLKCEHDKWYVGISTNIKQRFQQHKSGFAGAQWTKLHPPIKVHYEVDLGVVDIERAQTYEGRVTRKYMEKYGDNNVRGGDLTDMDDYLRRFGRFFRREDWLVLTTMIFLLIIILYSMADRYLLHPACG